MDALLFGLTVARTWAFPRKGDGLPHIIRRDGALYFMSVRSYKVSLHAHWLLESWLWLTWQIS
jgi:hypothetical protein